MIRIVPLLFIGMLGSCLLRAQIAEPTKPTKPDHDTTYYRSFKGVIIGRVYLSRNYMQYKLDPARNYIPAMSYRANKPLSLGVGITYKSFSFSYSKGLNFLQSKNSKGETKSTDLQLHLYKRKWTIDALAMFYRGYYLNPHGLGTEDGSYYKRPDLHVSVVGTSVYRVLNDRRFSYGAGLSQNAWQRKSAGSFLLGGEAFYLAIHGDSSFVPHSVDSTYYKSNIRKLHIFEVGPGAGYAYDVVIKKHFFVLGSINANMNFRVSREIGHSSGTKLGFSPNYMFRLSTGYTTSRWSVNFAWLETGVHTDGKASDYQYNMWAGNYRLVYARRFAINKKMRAILGADSYQ
jgi:hypothetical protein